MTHLFGKELLIQFTMFRELLSCFYGQFFVLRAGCWIGCIDS